MKQKLRLLMTMLLMAVFSSTWAEEEVTVTFSEKGYSNERSMGNETYDGLSFVFKRNGGTQPAYYITGAAVRLYAKNSLTISSEYNITNIVISFGSGDGSNSITTDVGSYSNGTWTGEAKSVTFTVGGTKGNRRLSSITVTYENNVTPQSSNIYVKSDYPPYIYTWTGDTKHTEEWPGTKVEATVEQNGITWYHLEVKASGFNMILHNNIGGSGNQTADIENVSGDVYYVWNSANDGYNAHDYLNVDFATVETIDLSLMVDGTGNGVTTKTPSGLQMTYESSDPNVATVDGEGNVTAVGKGSATITVSWVTQVVERQGYVNGSATYNVAVKKDPALAFSTSSVTADINDEYTPPTLTYAEDYDGTITYTSSNSAITVNPNTGEVTFGNDAVGKTTTITATAPATDNFIEGTAKYVLTVTNRNAVTGNLNNATFGTSYTGAITPITSFTSVSGQIGDVTVTYSKGTSSNAYINDNQIRLYNGIILSFEAPNGYAIGSLTFNTSISSCSVNVGSISSTTWTAPEDNPVSVVTFTGTAKIENVNTVTINLIPLTSSIEKPTITPASGTYNEAQTVTITNNEEGATVYYTKDGTTPTASSTEYTEPFVLGQNGTYTIKAIAINSEGESRVVTSTITIDIHVDAPTITPAGGVIDETTDITITAAEGATIYYTTDGKDPVENGTLTGTAKAYTGAFHMTKAGTVKAVSKNSDGVFSEITTASYTYNGTAELPYYERFDAGLGNFITIGTGEDNLAWNFRQHTDQSFIDKYGEIRKYAYCSNYQRNGDVVTKTKSGTARFVSPILDLTTNGLSTVRLNFIHAGSFFPSEAAMKSTCRVQIITDDGKDITSETVLSDASNWEDLTVPSDGWFDFESTTFPRKNSGDISLDSYAGNKVRICFLFDADATNNYGNWNVDQISVRGELIEKVNIPTPSGVTVEKGYTTYVTKNDIDAATTYSEKGVALYKVVEFDANKVVLVQLGMGTGKQGDNTYSETLIPANSPVLVKGDFGENDLVLTNSHEVIPKLRGNLLRSAMEGVTATANDRFFVLQHPKSVGAYGFHMLGVGKTLEGRKAYLNGVDEVEELTITTNAKRGIFFFGEETDVEIVPDNIEATAHSQLATDHSIYDLQGRKVDGNSKLPKGIYITNGKKFVVK